MSDSLKDIISIGQLTGDDCTLNLVVDDSEFELDVYNFMKHLEHTEAKCFASREIISQCLVAKQASAELKFSGTHVSKGKVDAVGFEVASFGDTPHDGIVLRIKHDN